MTRKKQPRRETIVPVETPEHRSPLNTETVLTSADMRKLHDYAYFLEALCTAFFAWDDEKKAKLTGSTASNLLKPFADEFYSFVHDTLDTRDVCDSDDREKAFQLLALADSRVGAA